MPRETRNFCLRCGKTCWMWGPLKNDWCIECNTKYVRKRKCLACRKQFVSESFNNRICVKCNQFNRHLVQSDILAISKLEKRS